MGLLKLLYFGPLCWLRRSFWQCLLRMGGGKLGPKAVIYDGVRIVQGRPGTITIGARARLLRNVTINTLPDSGEVSIGNDVHIGEGTMITSNARVEIGDNVVIGPYNGIVDVDHAFVDRAVPISRQGLVSRPIVIGAGAWISSHCMILKGVTIGRGTIIGAGAVVTRDVPDFTIAAGNPARIVRTWGDDSQQDKDVKKKDL